MSDDQVKRLGYADQIEDDDKNEEEQESEPYLYRANIFLPGAAATVKIGKSFPFLAFGRFLPIVDFLSDIGSAGSVVD